MKTKIYILGDLFQVYTNKDSEIREDIKNKVNGQIITLYNKPESHYSISLFELIDQYEFTRDERALLLSYKYHLLHIQHIGISHDCYILYVN